MLALRDPARTSAPGLAQVFQWPAGQPHRRFVVKPIERILVPTDFSEHSTEATRFAADLARRYDASLELLHVFQTTTHALPEGYVLPTPEELE
ncbi:MAG TPA: universal stress protein, partial [Polyangiales bacterium]|nr:universal stress protein [Polyangiales bacterium]